MIKSLEKFFKSKSFALLWGTAIFGILSLLLISYIQTDKLILDIKNYLGIIYIFLGYLNIILILNIIKTYNPRNLRLGKKFLAFKTIIFIAIGLILLGLSTDFASKSILMRMLFTLIFSIDSRFCILIACNLAFISMMKLGLGEISNSQTYLVYSYYFIIITVLLKIFDNTILSD